MSTVLHRIEAHHDFYAHELVFRRKVIPSARLDRCHGPEVKIVVCCLAELNYASLVLNVRQLELGVDKTRKLLIKLNIFEYRVVT